MMSDAKQSTPQTRDTAEQSSVIGKPVLDYGKIVMSIKCLYENLEKKKREVGKAERRLRARQQLLAEAKKHG